MGIKKNTKSFTLYLNLDAMFHKADDSIAEVNSSSCGNCSWKFRVLHTDTEVMLLVSFQANWEGWHSTIKSIHMVRTIWLDIFKLEDLCGYYIYINKLLELRVDISVNKIPMGSLQSDQSLSEHRYLYFFTNNVHISNFDTYSDVC